ncbi:MAG: PIN domain-containing protein [Caulobacteraceae bacterium]
MILSLDTNVMIDILNDREGRVRARYSAARAGGDRLVACSITAQELIYGAMISPRPRVHVPNAERLLEELEIEPWTPEDGVATARLRLALRKTGSTIGALDALIAGQALHRNWVMVSANLREFERVEGLRVIDWKADA